MRSLGNVHAEYDSAYGLVTTDWTRGADGGLELSVHTPANTTATVYLPGAASSKVTQDGKALNARREGDAFVTSIGSGTYRFVVAVGRGYEMVFISLDVPPAAGT